jgi:Arylsulfotransferase (ASST)
MRAIVAVVWAAACTPDATVIPEVEPPAPTETTPVVTTPDPTSPTTSGPYAKPVDLTVDCVQTGNVLRYNCSVTVDPPQPVQVTWTRLDGLGVARTHTSDAVAGEHEVLAYFLAADTDYTFTASAVAWPDDPRAIQVVHVNPVPIGIDAHLQVSGASTMGLIGTHNPCNRLAVPVIYDTDTGDLVWYEMLDDEGWLDGNNMVRFTPRQTVMGETGTSIVEVDLTGADLHVLEAYVDYTAGLHHDMAEHDDVFYGLEQYQHSTEPDGGAILDRVLMFDATTGDEVGRWIPGEHLDVPLDATGDWLHTNTVAVDEAGDIYLSWLTQSSIGKIAGLGKPNFGEVLWIIEGENLGLTKTLDVDWGGVPDEDSFSFEHSLSTRADGRVMVLDNTHGRALVFTIDEANGRAVVDGAYDTVEGSCGPQGTAQETGTGNVLSGCAGAFIREYDVTTGDMLWEAEAACENGNAPYAVRWYALDGWE